jgi:hypothetical protein
LLRLSHLSEEVLLGSNTVTAVKLCQLIMLTLVLENKIFWHIQTVHVVRMQQLRRFLITSLSYCLEKAENRNQYCEMTAVELKRIVRSTLIWRQPIFVRWTDGSFRPRGEILHGPRDDVVVQRMRGIGYCDHERSWSTIQHQPNNKESDTWGCCLFHK